MNPKKCTDNEVTVRANILAKSILSGESIDLNELAQRWNVTYRTIQNYMVKAKELIVCNTEIDLKFERSKTYRRLENLYSMAIEAMDLKTALSVLEKQSKIFGLENSDNEVTNIVPSSFKIEMTNLTIDDENELRELREFKQKQLKLVS